MDQPVAPQSSSRRKLRNIRMTRPRKVAAMTVFLMMFAGIAYAFWSTTGAGSGNNQTSSNIASTVTASVSPGADSELWPGNTTAADLHFTVDNPNPYDITFTSATVGTITGSGTCLATDFLATPGSITLTTPLAVPAGATSVAGTVPGAIKLLNLPENQDDCQNVVISAVVNLTGTQDQ